MKHMLYNETRAHTLGIRYLSAHLPLIFLNSKSLEVYNSFFKLASVCPHEGFVQSPKV